MTKIYQSDNKIFLRYILTINISLIIIYFILSFFYFEFNFIVIVGILFLVNISIIYSLSKSPIKIIINKSRKQNIICLVYRLRNKKCFKLDDVSVSIDIELTSRTMKSEVFNIRKGENVIEKIIPKNTGWSLNDLKDISTLLDKK